MTTTRSKAHATKAAAAQSNDQQRIKRQGVITRSQAKMIHKDAKSRKRKVDEQGKVIESKKKQATQEKPSRTLLPDNSAMIQLLWNTSTLGLKLGGPVFSTTKESTLLSCFEVLSFVNYAFTYSLSGIDQESILFLSNS